MAERMTIDELKSYLWQSAVLLRTNIDAGAYKQYIFPLLFFKRICDVYDEETQTALEESGGDEEYAAYLDLVDVSTETGQEEAETLSGKSYSDVALMLTQYKGAIKRFNNERM